MIARYPGRCARTGAPIRPGDTIHTVYPNGRKEYALTQTQHTTPASDPDLSLAESVDPELAQSDPEAAAAAGRYLRQSLQRGVSHVWQSGGREYYRNRRGRCEDAPCCGCCTA